MNLQNNLFPSVLAGHIASKFLHEMGLLIFVGSLKPFKENTPNFLAYGVSKNAVHCLALTMSKREELRSESRVICILPDILNTLPNRIARPDEDHKKWITPNEVSKLLYVWAQGKNTPTNGSFVGFKKEKNEIIQEYL